MKTIFENEDFRLNLTEHPYDFVGVIESKSDEPITFFFSEELCGSCDGEDDDWDDIEIDESETKLLEVYKGADDDEEQDTAMQLCADSYFRTSDDKSTGFLSEPRERGQFLALVKHYCPDQLANISWA